MNWEERLDTFYRLQENWDSYNAEPPKMEVIERVRVFLAVALSLEVPIEALNPSVVGGVGITFSSAGRKLYIEFRNTDSVIAIKSIAGGYKTVHVTKSIQNYIYFIKGFLDGYENNWY